MRKISFVSQLFISVALLFLAFVFIFVFFQYTREKEYRESLMAMRLQDFNNSLPSAFGDADITDSLTNKLITSYVDAYVKSHDLDSMRVTVILTNGKVVYDNFEKDLSLMSNHLDRSEVKGALKNGIGNSINRLSETLTANFFYSATYFNDKQLVVRSAMPYDVTLSNALKVDRNFIYFAIIISILLSLVFYRYASHMGNYIDQLRAFVRKAKEGGLVEPETISIFPNNDLAEISQDIVSIYGNLQHTKEALTIEREKLFSHLTIAREGLCIFNSQNQCILANSLFTQYTNMIADFPLSSNEKVFSLPEFSPLLKFVDEEKGGEQRTSFEIEKDGRIFSVECVRFQDNSFEISISDVTQKVEQSRLKQQLTQNVAHELKTPICSIQGYLETIIENENTTEEVKAQFLNRCYAQSNRLVNLLRDITVLTRMDEATQLMDKEMVDLSQMVQNIQRETALQLDAKKMRFNNLLPASMPIIGNASLLYSIFRNLTDNAIAYAGEGTTITLRCFRTEDDFYYFSFADNGVGVGSEHLNRLFERFYRVDKGRSRKMGGTGLGLAIVKNAVLFHGGSISAKNLQTSGLEFLFSLHR